MGEKSFREKRIFFHGISSLISFFRNVGTGSCDLCKSATLRINGNSRIETKFFNAPIPTEKSRLQIFENLIFFFLTNVRQTVYKRWICKNCAYYESTRLDPAVDTQPIAKYGIKGLFGRKKFSHDIYAAKSGEKK